MNGFCDYSHFVILSFYDREQAFLHSPAAPQPSPGEQRHPGPRGRVREDAQTGTGESGELLLPPSRHVACALGSQSFGGWGPCRHPHFSAALLFLQARGFCQGLGTGSFHFIVWRLVCKYFISPLNILG